jgi:hypothetical protein
VAWRVGCFIVRKDLAAIRFLLDFSGESLYLFFDPPASRFSVRFWSISRKIKESIAQTVPFEIR